MKLTIAFLFIAAAFGQTAQPVLLVIDPATGAVRTATFDSKSLALTQDANGKFVLARIDPGVVFTAKDDMQKILNSATCDAAVVLKAKDVWIGNFVLPVRQDSCTVTIQSSGTLPPDGYRIGPSDQDQMAVLQTPNEITVLGNSQKATHGWEFRGIDFTVTPGNNETVWDIVEFTVDSPNKFSDMPHHITFLHCGFHGMHDFTKNYIRGLWPGAQFLTVRDSRFYDIHSQWMESACVGSFNAVGDQEFVNNSFVCAAENVIYGSNVKLPIPGWIPSRILFRNNFFGKDPEYWTHPDAKNLFIKNLWECKHCQFVLLDGNVFYDNHAKNQTGFAILLSPRTGDTPGLMPWATASDITIVNNTIRRAVGGIAMANVDSRATGVLTLAQLNPARNIIIRNNLLDDLSSRYDPNYSTNFVIGISVSGPNNAIIDHNTINSEHYGHYTNAPFGSFGTCPPWPPVTEAITNNVINAPAPIVADCTNDTSAFEGLDSSGKLTGKFTGNYFPQFARPADPKVFPQTAVDSWLKAFPSLITPTPGAGADLAMLARIEAAVVAGVPVNKQ